jgi:hypothetical protein
MWRWISPTTVAYLCFLFGFVALGAFVYALAAGSVVAGIIGAVLVACFAIAVAGFRLGAKKLVASNLMESPLDGANIWARPMRQDQIDRYLLAYRGGPAGPHEPRPVTALPAEPRAADYRRAA